MRSHYEPPRPWLNLTVALVLGLIFVFLLLFYGV